MSAYKDRLSRKDEESMHMLLVAIITHRNECGCPIDIQVQHGYRWSAHPNHQIGCHRRLFRMHDLPEHLRS